MENQFGLAETYRYLNLEQDLKRLKNKYSDLTELATIGLSVEGRKIYRLKVGTGQFKVLCHGAHHAREWMTSRLIVDLIYHLLSSQNRPWRQMREDWLDMFSFWFVPMVNPDGVTLVQDGPNHFSNREQLLDLNGQSMDFSSWKANSRGVDLNRQYPTDWDEIHADPGQPSPTNYKGEYPLSEPEVKALIDFVTKNQFDCALAYHSSGEEIFWRYKLPNPYVNQFRPLAEKLANVTSYSLIEPEGIPSGGGFTDWFLTEFKKPSFTFEIAPYVGARPVPNHLYHQIFEDNQFVLHAVGEFLIDKITNQHKI